MDIKGLRASRIRWHIAGFFVACLFAGCTPPEPVRIGFLGGLSGRAADLGVSGRNGVTIAIEMRNQAGGVKGRRVELLPEDDQQDAKAAKESVARLIGRKVDVIVGPMTSAMAVAVVPQVNEARVLMISPTVSTKTLTGIDDMFLRVISQTTEYARKSASAHYALGWRHVAPIIDERNQSYTESWLGDYQLAFTEAGGKVATPLRFSSGDATQLAVLAQQLVNSRASGILILANSVDTALLAQQVRKLDDQLPLATSEWAATERLLELGGKAVEGMTLAQFLDRESMAPAYLAFRKAYMARFGQEPGFGGLAGFDAANVALEGLEARTGNQTLKQAILSRQTFQGAQAPIRFDAYGDTFRETYLTTIRNGAFVRLH